METQMTNSEILQHMKMNLMMKVAMKRKHPNPHQMIETYQMNRQLKVFQQHERHSEIKDAVICNAVMMIDASSSDICM